MKLEQMVEASKSVSLEVGDNEARVLRFREEKVAELVSKVREKNEGPPSAATLRQTRAACAELDKELTDLRAYQARVSSSPRAQCSTSGCTPWCTRRARYQTASSSRTRAFS